MLINIIRWPIQREFEFLGISLFLETLETMFPKWFAKMNLDEPHTSDRPEHEQIDLNNFLSQREIA